MAPRGCADRRPGAWVGRLAVWSLATLQGAPADFSADLYAAARSSGHMRELSGDTLGRFLEDRPAPSLMVIFHVGTCHICREALPAVELVAKALHHRGLAVGHVDCSQDKSLQRRLGFQGFPAILFWRRAEAAAGGPGGAPNATALRGQLAKVSSDRELVLVASRLAAMTTERDAKRLRALGLEGTVREVDLNDHTVRVEVAGAGSVWLPLEAVSTRAVGAEWQAPFPRPEMPFKYSPTGWSRESVQDFAEKMLRDPVVPLSGLRDLEREMVAERFPAFVLCAQEPLPEFVRAAKLYQDRYRSFHAAGAAACPASTAKPALVVYAPSGQLWGPTGSGARPAVTVGGPEVAALGFAGLATWMASHRFPGVVRVDYENFHEFVQNDRSSALVAVRVGAGARALQRVREAAAPRDGGGVDVFSYGDKSPFWGICDGELNGLSSFGIHARQLPRVVVFESKDRWVEDAYELTVDRLSSDIEKLPTLARHQRGFAGWLVVSARDFHRVWKIIHGFCAGRFGSLGTAAALAILIGGVCLVVLCSMRVVSAFLRSLIADDAQPAGAEPAKPKDD